MSLVLIKFLIRFAAFGVIFGLVSYKRDDITIKPKYALPLVALAFALLNAGLYWLLSPVLNLATLGLGSLFMPFALNAFFLLLTARLIKRARVQMSIDSIRAVLWLAFLLTVAHGALYLAFDLFL